MAMIDRKRILLVIKHPAGGIGTYIKYIYGQDVFDAYDFTIIAPEWGDKLFFEEIFDGRNFEYISCVNDKDMFINLWRYTNKDNVGLIHSHGFTSGCLSVFIARYKNIPHLMTAHDVFQDGQFVGYKGYMKKWILSRLFSRIDKIHTVSHDASNDLFSYIPAIKEDKVICIPHGIDTELFYSSDKAEFNFKHDRSNTCFIGFFGRFMAQKGFRVLIDAIDIIIRDKLTDKKPLVLTSSWGGFVREDYQTLTEMKLQNYFKMIDYSNNMPGLIKAMDMVVMPSLWEACGLLGMESLVSGVPIIGSSCIGLREVLSNSPAVLVPPMDSESLARAIANEMNKPRKKEFEQYSSIARERFSLQTPSVELKKLYIELVSV